MTPFAHEPRQRVHTSPSSQASRCASGNDLPRLEFRFTVVVVGTAATAACSPVPTLLTWRTARLRCAPPRLCDKHLSIRQKPSRAKFSEPLRRSAPANNHQPPAINHKRDSKNQRGPHRKEKMAAVYKSLSKGGSQKSEAPSNGVKKNKQRVLILSSRGVTYRSVCRHRVPAAIRA